MTDWSSAPRAVGDCSWSFPPVSQWPDHDVVATGADLDPATVIAAYRRGLFPMELQARRRALAWWSPDPRGILPLDRLRVTRSMRQSAKHYRVRVDTCFVDVMRGCADPSRHGAWITGEFIAAYTTLHQLGWAHSVEVFDRDDRLTGGLYGVRINRLFAGESMFHIGRDASKVALMALVELMRESAMILLDVQWSTDHLASLGAIEIGRDDYLARLAAAVAPEPAPL
ncbi:MAG: leucyl/phenylalanyl-tRNA--protein transferase [Acidobacteriota bacterium]